MTDNYQIDKNSKLFQKFLNLKNNKTAEPPQDKHQETNPPKSLARNTGESSNAPIYASTTKNNNRATMHVTIGDIEEAASLSFQE